MTIAAAVNPYLFGNFAPVRDERGDDELAATGAIPPELEGLLLRNGPNPVVAPEPSRYHWFIGDGMLHGIELSGSRARYQNRWVRTPKAAAAPDEAVPTGAREATPIELVANTNVVAHAGRIYALVAAPPGASIQLPGRVPFGFHGSWLPGESLG
jgi:carotenoid cleavage dioxygenase